MSTLKPFAALRPRPEYAREVAAPPYDVLNAAEARRLVAGNPNSFLRVNKAELEFDDDTDPYGEVVYQRGKDNLQRLIDEQILVQDTHPCFYLYRLTMDGQSQTGLVALASVDEYDRGTIVKHEHTRPEKVADRADHIAFLQAQVGPVFLTYRHDPAIAQLFARLTAASAAVDFVADDDVRHEFWIVDDGEAIGEIGAAFGRLPALYIADGHHRSQAASEVRRRQQEKHADQTGDGPHNCFLSVAFPDRELRILPYNRVIRDLGGLTIEQVLEHASANFEVRLCDTPVEPDRPHCCGMYCAGRWFRLSARPGSFDPADPTGSIDATILGDNFIAPILGITDPKVDRRIGFVGGRRGVGELIKLVDSGEYALAFSLFATSIEQLLRVADAGAVMPPKSTWFEPKLRSGMAVHVFGTSE